MKLFMLRRVGRRRVFILGETVFVLGAMIFLYFSSQPRLIAPSSGLVIDDFDFHFEIDHAERILISPYESFEEVIYLEKNMEIVLAPGTYYWKAVSFLGESEVRNFTIRSQLVLKIDDTGEFRRVFNEGNVPVNVTQNSTSVVIPEKDSALLGSGDVEGRQS